VWNANIKPHVESVSVSFVVVVVGFFYFYLCSTPTCSMAHQCLYLVFFAPNGTGNACNDTYCDTCFWRCHNKGNLKLHTWKPLLDMCMYCEDQEKSIAVRVDVPGARQYQTPFSLELNQAPPLNDHMCNRCYNTSWYPNGYTSVPLEFTCYAVQKEQTRIQTEINMKLAEEAKKRRKEADDRRKIIKLVSRLQANYRRRKTGHVWGGRLKNLHVDLLIKKRMDKLKKYQKSWYYKVADTIDKAPPLEIDDDAELERKLLPRQMRRSDLLRLYPWMSTKQLNTLCLQGTKPHGIEKAINNVKWTFSKQPLVKVKNGMKASVKIAGITAEAVFGDAFDEEHRERYALWMAQKATEKKRKFLFKTGTTLNKKFTNTAANLEERFRSRNFLTKVLRRRARKMLLMSKRQHRLDRRDELMKERWVEIDRWVGGGGVWRDGVGVVEVSFA